MADLERSNYEEEVCKKVICIIKNIAKERIDGEVDLDASIMDEYAFNSIDVMDVLIEIQEEFSSEDNSINVSNFLENIYQEFGDGVITTRSIVNHVLRILDSSKELCL